MTYINATEFVTFSLVDNEPLEHKNCTDQIIFLLLKTHFYSTIHTKYSEKKSVFAKITSVIYTQTALRPRPKLTSAVINILNHFFVTNNTTLIVFRNSCNV